MHLITPARRQTIRGRFIVIAPLYRLHFSARFGSGLTFVNLEVPPGWPAPAGMAFERFNGNSLEPRLKPLLR